MRRPLARGVLELTMMRLRRSSGRPNYVNDMLPNGGFYHDTRAAAQRNRSRRGLIRTLRRTLTATQGRGAAK